MLHFIVDTIMHGYNTVEHSTTGANNCTGANGPYSLLVRASYFIYYSVYARSTSVILSFANGAGGVGVF